MNKISVILPVYNEEKYLPDCIQCLKKQTYENFEAVFIDDGSTDHSGRILDAVSKEDARFIAVHKKNGGAAQARNCGLNICTGDYVCFVDTDDLVAPDYLETLLKYIVEYGCDIVQCGYRKVETRKDVRLEKKKLDENTVDFFTNIEMLQRIYSEFNVDTIVLWNKIYKRSVLSDVRFPEGIMFEDEVFSAKVIYNAQKIGIISCPMYYYYVNDASIMNRSYTLRKLDILPALQDRMNFYKEKNLWDLYQKDSYKYLYKILQNYYHIHHNLENKKEIEKKIMRKYWKKYRETLNFQWSGKRKFALFCFGVFPLTYSWFRNV